MTERIVPGCEDCSKPAEGVFGLNTTMGGVEPERATCRACADASIDLAVEMDMIRSAIFRTWTELETSAPDKLERFAPRR